MMGVKGQLVPHDEVGVWIDGRNHIREICVF